MNVALRKPRMSRDQFFAWAEAEGGRWEFDGLAPVAMTGGTVNHSQIVQSVLLALHSRLGGSGCRPLGPDAGVATIADAVRYPDALVTCTSTPGDAYLVPGVIVVFEVLSPNSGRIDRIVKLREYRAVPSIRRYVIVEHNSLGLIVLERNSSDAEWIASALTAEDTLRMPEIGIEVPVVELYQGVDLPEGGEEEDRRPA